MKQINIVRGTLSLMLLACTHTGTPAATSPSTPASQEQSDGSPEKTSAAQEAINRYFHSAVVPKMRACWDRLKGEGTIEMAFTYFKSGGGWALESVGGIRSSLPEEQGAAALRCMQDSARATSFTLRGEDLTKKFEKFVLKWTWLVPLPAENSETMARMAGGVEPTAGCAKCKPDIPARCVWSQSGEADCRVDGPQQCSTSGTKCLSGIYGRAGNGIVIF